MRHLTYRIHAIGHAVKDHESTFGLLTRYVAFGNMDGKLVGGTIGSVGA
jgi:hypothetical protein